MTTTKNEIHEISRGLRKQHGITQANLAIMAGVSLPALQRFEAGNATARMDTIRKILAALGYELTVRPSTMERDRDNRLKD